MVEYDVKIQGITPILFNRFIESSIDSEIKKRAGAVKKSDPEDKLYKTAEGLIYTPSTHIQGMLISSSKEFKIRGKRTSTYSKLVGSSVDVNPDAIVHKIQTWVPYSVSAVVPSTRGRMMVTRPKMDKWEIEFTLKFNDDDIPVEVIKNILDHGGQYNGLGDWRPEKKGKFGKFIVTEFKQIEDKK